MELPVYAPENVNHPLWIERIRELKPDVIFSFYYRDMLSEELLALAPKGHLTYMVLYYLNTVAVHLLTGRY